MWCPSGIPTKILGEGNGKKKAHESCPEEEVWEEEAFLRVWKDLGRHLLLAAVPPLGQYHSNTKNDFVDGLERERRTVARRLHEQDNGIGERLVRLGNESMLRPSSRDLGAAALDDTRIAA